MAVEPTPQTTQIQPAERPAGTIGPFFGLLDCVLVEEAAGFVTNGAIDRGDAVAAWTWMVRDLAADLIDAGAPGNDPAQVAALDALMPQLLARARERLEAAGADAREEHRLRTQLGAGNAFDRLPVILNALRCRALFAKAQTFGRAANGIHDDGALDMALQAMPLSDRSVAPLLFQAIAGQVATPNRLVTAAIRIARGAHEADLVRAGFGPLVDALLSHAQNQIPPMAQTGAFADIDLVCRSIERFHRLMRAVGSYIELERLSSWSRNIAVLTRVASERIEQKLRSVYPDLSQAMRRREGSNRVDSDQILAALNGIFLLTTVRDCRDSLAVNALLDPAWANVGQALEQHLQRNLDALRKDRADAGALARLDAGIKMAELRFGADYAVTLRRARAAVCG